jgi:hypothetical protein
VDASSDAARLEAVLTAVDELTDRVTRLAEDFERAVGGREGAAADLFDVERSLRAASRRLGGVLRQLG